MAIASELGLYAHSLIGSPFAPMSLAEARDATLRFVDVLVEGASSSEPALVQARGGELAARLRGGGYRLPELQRVAARLRTVVVPVVAAAYQGDRMEASEAISRVDELVDALIFSFGESYLQTTTDELKRLLEEQREALATLEDRSQRDSLTGLYNHAHFYAALTTECERARRYGRPLTLILLDLDYFKAINDQYGHPTGDDVLVRVSRVMADLLRKSDILARYGGEEFGVILPETSWEQGVDAAEKLRRGVAGERFGAAGEPFSVTISAGVAGYQVHGGSAGDLVWAADRALYAAKNAGRDRVEGVPRDVSTEVPSEDAPRRLRDAR